VVICEQLIDILSDIKLTAISRLSLMIYRKINYYLSKIRTLSLLAASIAYAGEGTGIG
jgi:hypothetical protein